MVKQYSLIADFGKKVDDATIGIVETVKNSNEIYKTFYTHTVVDLFIYKGLPWDKLIDKFSYFYEIPELKGCPIICDANGVGDVVIDYMRKAKLNVVPVLTTTGERESINEDVFHVAKKILVSVFMQSLSLKKWFFAKKLPYSAKLLTQFENFQLKMSSNGNETYENAKDSIHDDLVTMCLLGNYILRKRFIDVFRTKNTIKRKKRAEYSPRKLFKGK